MSDLKETSLALLRRPLKFIRRQLPPLNFITIHYTYFIVTCMLSAIILWGSSTPARSLSFTNALFLAISAMTLAGLNTVNLSSLNTFQQFWLFLLIMLGSAIFVSAFVVHVRRNAFERKLTDVIQSRNNRGRGRSRSHMRTWSLSRRTSMGPSNEANGATEEKMGQPSPQLGNDFQPRLLQRRESTPPARRGGPEMNDAGGDDEAVEDEIGAQKENDLPPRSSGLQFRADTVFNRHHRAPSSASSQRRHGLFHAQGVGAAPRASLEPTLTTPKLGTLTPVPEARPRSKGDIGKYFESMGGWISRNSQFHGLTDKERERLGGYEYRAVKFLSWLVPAYFIAWQLLGCLGCAAWVATQRPNTARANGLNPWWVGAFNAVSAFNNSGMSLLDANMVAFQTGYYLLITMSLLILAGNTCYPIFLRLIIWCMYKLVQRIEDRSEEWAERARTLRFLLDHPRRCYTHIFPSRPTWWLLLSVVTLNGVDWAAFEILNIGNKAIEVLPTNVRVIDGLFQAFAVRSGGFYVVTISALRISLQVLYVVMMYISVYPVSITLRNSNVYEERSLGIYADDEENPENKPTTDGPGALLRHLTNHLTGATPAQESNATFVRQQLRAQLAHDAWIIVLALFLIMIVESGEFDRDPKVFSVFNFLFEIVSAYGCVGISVGVPDAAYSFSGSWRVLSKLILCVVMLRGRHRGLPVAIDKAVLLPREQGGVAEEDDGRIRVARTMSRARPLSAGGTVEEGV